MALSRGRAAAVLALSAVALIGAVVAALLLWPDDREAPPTAVIIDQLAATDANPEFVSAATASLQAAGYRVDYVPSEAVTVDFYAGLPGRGYDIVIVRSHALQEVFGLRRDAAGNPVPEREVGIFTNERYDQRAHVDDQLRDRLTIASYPEQPERFFAIAPGFVRETMRGDFGGATFVLLGCGGLNSEGMAQALTARGVANMLSWNDRVTAEHNDVAGAELIRSLVIEGLAPREAAAATMAQLGPDPGFSSTLLAYP